MEKLKKHIHDDSNGLDYVLVGDYYIPDLQLPEESRPIGRWGRMHREYLQEYCPDRYNELLLSGKLWTYLADLDEQVQNRLDGCFGGALFVGQVESYTWYFNKNTYTAQGISKEIEDRMIKIGGVQDDDRGCGHFLNPEKYKYMLD